MSVRTLYKKNSGIVFFIVHVWSIAYVKTTILVFCIYLSIRSERHIIDKKCGNFHHSITITFRSSQELSFMHVNYYSARRN